MYLTLTFDRLIVSVLVAKQKIEFKMVLGWTMEIIPSLYCFVFSVLHLGHNNQLECIKQ